jgi:RNA polymerase sigma-70 factor (ECF subfamily)
MRDGAGRSGRLVTAFGVCSVALVHAAVTLRAADASAPEVETEVLAAQSGDLAAFGRIYREHVGRVYALCMRLAADRVFAEQLTQDTFVRAWERIATYRGESSFATWLRRLAINVVMAERRVAHRRARRVVTADDETLARAPLHRSDDTDIDLERAIARLPEGARTVFVLHAIEGYRHDEIAELTGIAEGTSRAHLHRAREILKKELT